MAARSSSAYAVVVCIVAAVGGFLFGFDSGVINGAVDAIAHAFGTQTAVTGFAVASVLIGCAVGAFSAGTLADHIGRRATILVNAIVFVVSAFFTGAASSAAMFIAARVCGGLAIGAASVLAPMYISELAPADLRGRLASLQQMAIVLGLFFAFVSNDLIASWAGGAGARFWLGYPAWRWMFWMEALPAVVLFVGGWFIPESPRYLVFSGQRERAKEVFARIGGDPEQQVVQVERSVQGEHRPRFSDLRGPHGGLAKIVWLGIALAAFQQFVGINIIFYYGEVLWKAAGANEQWALRINLITGLVNVLATIPAILMVDRVGRKPLLLGGSIGMAATMTVMAVAFSSSHLGPDNKPELGHAAALTGLVAANLYVIAFAISWGPVIWVLLGEMFPNRLRGAGLAVSGASNWIANFLVTVSFLPLLKAVGLGVSYGLYAAAALISFFLVAKAVTETKGRALEEM